MDEKFELVHCTEDVLQSYTIEFGDVELQDEEWRPVVIPYKYRSFIIDKKSQVLFQDTTNYYVSSLGRCAVKRNGRLWMKRVCTDDDGYKKTDIAGKLFFVHRLVALVFIDNDDYEHKNLVNHVNHIRYDNRASNLEWCDLKYNNQRPFDRAAQQRINQINQVNMHISEPLMRIGSIDGKDLMATKSAVKSYRFDEFAPFDYKEEWKPFSEMPEHSIPCLRPREKELLQSNLYASTHGRFASFDGKRFILKKVCNEKNGYLFISINHTVQRVHRLVALMFVYDENMEFKEYVDHINHVKFQNDIRNLRWVTSSENRQNMPENARNVKGCQNIKNRSTAKSKSSIKCANIDTDETILYDTLKSAVAATGISESRIVFACQRNSHGISTITEEGDARYKFEYDKVTLHNKDAVVQLTIRGEFVNVFKTSKELKASISSEMRLPAIFTCCRQNHKKRKTLSITFGYIWMFLDDYNDKMCNNDNERIELENMVLLTPKNMFVGVYSRRRMLEENKSLDMVYKFYDVPASKILGSFKYVVYDRTVRCKWIRESDWLEMAETAVGDCTIDAE